jgi:hypothetical protein
MSRNSGERRTGDEGIRAAAEEIFCPHLSDYLPPA